MKACPAALQIIMICTARTGSSTTCRSSAPQIAEKANPATLDTRAETKTASMTGMTRSAGPTPIGSALRRKRVANPSTAMPALPAIRAPVSDANATDRACPKRSCIAASTRCP